MFDLNKRKSVDLLIEQLWRNGYMTLSRKFGTYLPEPEKVGGFEIDIVARHNKSYAIGITLSEEDLVDPDLLKRIKYLATRKTKFSNNSVMLFIGVPLEHFEKMSLLISSFEEDVQKNIKLFRIVDNRLNTERKQKTRNKALFS